MTDIERLLAIEEIKQVKARYFHALDHKDWEQWRREVWAPDCELHVPEFRAEPFVGWDAIIAQVSSVLGDQVTVHHGHMPIIDFTSDTSAQVIWAMEDRLYFSKDFPLYDDVTFLHGWGHYRETYNKLAVGWRLHKSQLTRLHIEMVREP